MDAAKSGLAIAVLALVLPFADVWGDTAASGGVGPRGSAISAPSRPAASRARTRIGAIVIDPGHGGRDPGAIHAVTVGSTTVELAEKDIVLEVAKRVVADLGRTFPHKRIVMTRSDDRSLELEERTGLANAIPLASGESGIFISIHANASSDGSAKGFEVFYLPPSFPRALIEPGPSDGRQASLYPILNSMQAEEYATESALLGRWILDGITEQTRASRSDRGLKADQWFVVRDAKMPAVLVELGFLTSATEGPRLADASYLQKLARGIYNGAARFVTYFDSFSGFTE